ncbi:uncharacterized protein LOC117642410 [Thrips palmi]|uniref:Uncharacterized protein LOC117642410 n=1 Tax=Thrips palmi TaxID=161013 RepID=A0A6P8YIK7_THRPL|nr:uncharacterized protein LOC117642410 [Thrips palmi]
MSPSPLSHNAATGPCAVCGEAGRPCARCRVHYYCGKEHQKKHWRRHKPSCGCIELRDGYVVATRDIPAGTLIMRERPTLTFPASTLNYYRNHLEAVLCVGCCADLGQDPPRQCRRCGLPVCDEACSRGSAHQVECQVFQRAKYQVEKSEFLGENSGAVFGAIVATLRIAVAFPNNPLLQHLDRELNFDEQGLKASPHAEEWVSAMQIVMAAVVRYVRRVVGVTWISERDLSRAARIAAMHAEDITGASPERWDNVAKQAHWGALFVGMQLRKHSCLPNSNDISLNSESKEYGVVTARDIAAGEFITNMLQGCQWVDDTATRRDCLLVHWGFVCNCERCSDPTELGMYVGSPCCPDCAGQEKLCYLVPVNDARSLWRCEGCDIEKTSAQVESLTKEAEDRLHEIGRRQYNAFLEFIEQQTYPRGPLHPTHRLVLRARAYVRDELYEVRADEKATNVELDRWEVVVRDQLRAVDRLVPGPSEVRVMLLLELRRLALRRLRVAERKTMMLCLACTSAMRETMLQISKYREAVLQVNKEILSHCFGRDEDGARRSLIQDPFGGR